MSDWRSRLDAEQAGQLERARLPEWTAPMLATLTDARFSSDDWIFERKLDGERCLVFRDHRGARLMSRNRTSLNDTYPELVPLLEQATNRTFVADGELVAFSGNRTSFSRLQARMRLHDRDAARASRVKVFLYLFDLLHYDGMKLDRLPLRTRKHILRRELNFNDGLRYTPHRNSTGEAFYRQACRKNWEGLIAKRANSRYCHSRSRDWLKFKCVNQQEFVIAGYTDPQGKRSGIGALLLGYYEDGKLRYAGKVGTGFDETTLSELHETLSSNERRRSPLKPVPDDADAHTHWVRPELVAEIGFTEWTDELRLRHPRFLGLRDDKPADKVHRETPA